MVLKYFTALLLVMLPWIAWSQPADMEAIRNLQDDWLVYDQKNDSYLPYAVYEADLVPAIHFHLPLQKYRHYHLYLGVPAGSSLWINQELMGLMEESVQTLSIDSLYRLYSQPSVFFSVFSDNLSTEKLKTYVMYERGLPTNSGTPDQLYTLSYRQNNQLFRDFYAIGFLLILFLYALLLNIQPKRFKTFYDISRTLSLNIREEYTFKGRTFNWSNLSIIFIHSILIAYMTLLLLGFGQLTPYIQITSLVGALWKLLLISLLVFGIFLLKFWLINLVAVLFHLQEVINRHYLEYLRMSKIFFALVFIIMGIIYLGFEVEIYKSQSIFINLIIVFLIIRAILLYFKFVRASSFKNFYLFAYLCSTEFLPLIIGLKFITDI